MDEEARNVDEKTAQNLDEKKMADGTEHKT
jgi:hypothetical protein